MRIQKHRSFQIINHIYLRLLNQRKEKKSGRVGTLLVTGTFFNGVTLGTLCLENPFSALCATKRCFLKRRHVHLLCFFFLLLRKGIAVVELAKGKEGDWLKTTLYSTWRIPYYYYHVHTELLPCVAD